jgi:hypothetical protein
VVQILNFCKNFDCQKIIVTKNLERGQVGSEFNFFKDHFYVSMALKALKLRFGGLRDSQKTAVVSKNTDLTRRRQKSRGALCRKNFYFSKKTPFTQI